MNARNYQRELDQIIASSDCCLSLLLHSCCAPCSSYVLEYLSEYFKITIDFYNPNIYPPQEFADRVKEQQYLIAQMNFKYPVRLLVDDYCPEEFYQKIKGYESCEEGGARCYRCYEMRLRHTGKKAAAGGFDYFTTTLSVSPLKNAVWLNEIGERVAGELGIAYLTSDFKKKGGYQRSVQLSKQYDLYRQDYCGCIFSAGKQEG